MKSIGIRDIFWAMIILISICLYSFLNRFEITTGDKAIAFKLDKITGKTWQTYALVKEWEPIINKKK